MTNTRQTAITEHTPEPSAYYDVIRELLESLEDLLGDLPSVQSGVCRHCSREYHDIDNGDCPSDDCPSFKARAALAKAGGVTPLPKQATASGRPDYPRLSEISRDYLGIPTLDTRRSDALDFHDVAVWQVQAALKAAFDAGVQSAEENAEPQGRAPDKAVSADAPNSLLLAKGTPLVPGKMYLRLYHGRTDPNQEMDDWGFTGPTFGPLACFVNTYCNTFRLHGESVHQELWLDRHDDMLVWDGCYYGDMEAFIAKASDKA